MAGDAVAEKECRARLLLLAAEQGLRGRFVIVEGRLLRGRGQRFQVRGHRVQIVVAQIQVSWFTRFSLPLRRSTTSVTFSARPVEGEPVSAICSGLIVAAIDRRPCEVPIEQGSRAAMPDNGDVCTLKGLRRASATARTIRTWASAAGSQPLMLCSGCAKNASTVAANSPLARKSVADRSFSPRLAITL
jgi:hypothetical protein